MQLMHPRFASVFPSHNVIGGEAIAIPDTNPIESFPGAKVRDGNSGDTLIVTVPYGKYNAFLASIERDDSKTKARTFDGIATLDGKLLVRYSDLREKDLVYTADDKEPVESEDGLITLYTKYGRVILNKETNTIVAGNNIYKLSDANTVLYSYEKNKQTGKSELYVDFRAAYGWTANIMDIVVSGSGQTNSVNVITRDTTKQIANVKEANVTKAPYFSGVSDNQKAGVIPGELVDGTKAPKLVPSFNYSLANYMIYYGVDRNGLEEDYCIVYYPAGVSINEEDAANGEQVLKRLFGYVTLASDWSCRAVPLNREVTTQVGKFTYSEQFGYLYNIPSNKEFTLDKYLSGEYLLPFSASASGANLTDYNVNAFAGLKYGQRPYRDQKTKKYYYIDVNGKKGRVSDSFTLNMYPAPVGVSMFYGGAGAVGSVADAVKVGFIGDENPVYFGSLYCDVKSNSKTGAVIAKESFSSLNPWSCNVVLLGESNIYQINVVPRYNSSTSVYTMSAVYAYFGGSVVTEELTEGEKEDLEEVTIITEKREDENLGYDRFSLDRLIQKIDEGTSW